jgi:branched-chain amino acid transport system ATP-binding protein
MLSIDDAGAAGARIDAEQPVLAATGISVSFGGVRALVDVDLSVRAGQLLGLIGPNGAGKTTFIDAVTGFVGHRGAVRLDGRDLAGLAPHERARLGLARTWQSIELFDDLTVRENIAVAAERPSALATLRDVVAPARRARDEQDHALRAFGLESLGDAMPSELSQADRKLVGVARALAAGPRLLCLDEPAAGLDSFGSEELGRRLRAIADDGLAMLLVDHDMGLVLSISDYVVVLEFGRVIAQGTPDAVRRDPKVISAYLGSAGAEVADGLAAESGA